VDVINLGFGPSTKKGIEVLFFHRGGGSTKAKPVTGKRTNGKTYQNKGEGKKNPQKRMHGKTRLNVYVGGKSASVTAGGRILGGSLRKEGPKEPLKKENRTCWGQT